MSCCVCVVCGCVVCVCVVSVCVCVCAPLQVTLARLRSSSTLCVTPRTLSRSGGQRTACCRTAIARRGCGGRGCPHSRVVTVCFMRAARTVSSSGTVVGPRRVCIRLVFDFRIILIENRVELGVDESDEEEYNPNQNRISDARHHRHLCFEGHRDGNHKQPKPKVELNENNVLRCLGIEIESSCVARQCANACASAG